MSKRRGKMDLYLSRPEVTNLRHGVHAVEAGKPVPARFPHIRDAVLQLKGELYSDEAIGTDEAPNAKRKVLIDSILRSVACAMLAFEDLERRGFLIEEEGKEPVLNPVVRVLASFENTARLGLVSLGLERRQRPTQTLEQYIEQTYGQESPESKQGTSSEGQICDNSPDTTVDKGQSETASE